MLPNAIHKPSKKQHSGSKIGSLDMMPLKKLNLNHKNANVHLKPYNFHFTHHSNIIYFCYVLPKIQQFSTFTFLFSILRHIGLFSYYSVSKPYLFVILPFHLISLQTAEFTRVVCLNFLWCYCRFLGFFFVIIFTEFFTIANTLN